MSIVLTGSTGVDEPYLLAQNKRSALLTMEQFSDTDYESRWKMLKATASFLFLR
jgi:hypothetical protein